MRPAPVTLSKLKLGKLKVVRRQLLQRYEHQPFVSCLAGLYGCQWRRYQRARAQPGECCCSRVSHSLSLSPLPLSLSLSLSIRSEAHTSSLPPRRSRHLSVETRPARASPARGVLLQQGQSLSLSLPPPSLSLSLSLY